MYSATSRLAFAVAFIVFFGIGLLGCDSNDVDGIHSEPTSAQSVTANSAESNVTGTTLVSSTGSTPPTYMKPILSNQIQVQGGLEEVFTPCGGCEDVYLGAFGRSTSDDFGNEFFMKVEISYVRVNGEEREGWKYPPGECALGPWTGTNELFPEIARISFLDTKCEPITPLQSGDFIEAEITHTVWGCHPGECAIPVFQETFQLEWTVDYV